MYCFACKIQSCYVLCFLSIKFKLPTGNNIPLRLFRMWTIFLFVSSNVSCRVKKRSRVFIHDRAIETRRRLKYKIKSLLHSSPAEQLSPLLICRQLLILLTTPKSFTCLNIHLVYPVLSSLGFNHIYIFSLIFWFVVIARYHHTHRRTSGLGSGSTSFCSFHLTDCKRH